MRLKQRVVFVLTVVAVTLNNRGVQIEFSCRKIQITCSQIKMLSFSHWSVAGVIGLDREVIRELIELSHNWAQIISFSMVILKTVG